MTVIVHLTSHSPLYIDYEFQKVFTAVSMIVYIVRISQPFARPPLVSEVSGNNSIFYYKNQCIYGVKWPIQQAQLIDPTHIAVVYVRESCDEFQLILEMFPNLKYVMVQHNYYVSEITSQKIYNLYTICGGLKTTTKNYVISSNNTRSITISPRPLFNLSKSLQYCFLENKFGNQVISCLNFDKTLFLSDTGYTFESLATKHNFDNLRILDITTQNSLNTLYNLSFAPNVEILYITINNYGDIHTLMLRQSLLYLRIDSLVHFTPNVLQWTKIIGSSSTIFVNTMVVG
jgi:hypothetical protein